MSHPIIDRQKILEYKLKGINKYSKDVNIMAERICRRLYEKAFNLDLDLPYGHPQNMFYYKNEDELRKHMMDEIHFWITLRDKYKDKQEHLSIAIASWADQQTAGRISVLANKNPTEIVNKQRKLREKILKKL